MSHFYCMPAFIAEDHTLILSTKFIYMYIFGYTSNKKECFYTNSVLAKKVGITVRHLQKGLAVLQERNLLVVYEKNGKRYMNTTNPMSFTTPPHVIDDTPPMSCTTPIIDKLINKDNSTENADALAQAPFLLKKYGIRTPKKLSATELRYLQKALIQLNKENQTLETYLEYLTETCPRALLPYIRDGVEKTNGFGNILRPSFIKKVLIGDWEGE